METLELKSVYRNEKFTKGTNTFERISEVDVRLTETLQPKGQNTKRMKRNGQSIRETCTAVHKCTHSGRTRGRGGKGAENELQRNNGWKHPRVEDSKSTSQELSDSQAENTKRRIAVKTWKQRQRGKSESGRRGIPLRRIPDVPETMEARRRWYDTAGVLKSRVT